MKYTIELSVRGKGLQLLSLDEDEKNELLEEDLDDVYLDWIERKDYDFDIESQYLMPQCDRFRLTIKDEDGNVVYETESVTDLKDRTYDEDDNEISGWEFDGVEDGAYLVRIQTIKGCYYTGEFELEESFDKDKLYIIRDTEINDELMGDDVFPIDRLYYQRGESADIDSDAIDLDFDSDMGEQYYDTYLMEVEDGDCWTDLQND